jgi:hypothetical protein
MQSASCEQETPAYPATTLSRTEWENRRKETNISKEHLDLLVMNFLVTEVLFTCCFSYVLYSKFQNFVSPASLEAPAQHYRIRLLAAL